MEILTLKAGDRNEERRYTQEEQAGTRRAEKERRRREDGDPVDMYSTITMASLLRAKAVTPPKVGTDFFCFECLFLTFSQMVGFYWTRWLTKLTNFPSPLP